MARYAWGSKRPLQVIKVVILSANSPFDVAKIRTYFVISKFLANFFISEAKNQGLLRVVRSKPLSLLSDCTWGLSPCAQERVSDEKTEAAIDDFRFLVLSLKQIKDLFS